MSRASKKAGSSTGAKRGSSSTAAKGRGTSAAGAAAGGKSRRKKAAKAPLATREMAAVVLDEEPMSQVTLKMRASQHRQLAKMAFNQGTTMRGVIMRALKAAGLKVTKQDLVDRRRR